jgi:predicted naringenin-chalcone synthase
MTDAFTNRIATALPPHDVHEGFIDIARRMLKGDSRRVTLLLAGEDRGRITHLIVTCCTGFVAPGIDLQLAERCALKRDIERTFVGFMGHTRHQRIEAGTSYSCDRNPARALAVSRAVPSDFGNISSAPVMYVLDIDNICKPLIGAPRSKSRAQ